MYVCVCIYINLCLKTFLIEKTNCLRVSAYFFLILHFFTWRVRNKQSRVCVWVLLHLTILCWRPKIQSDSRTWCFNCHCLMSSLSCCISSSTPYPSTLEISSHKLKGFNSNSKSFWTLNKCSNPVQVLTRALFLMDVSLQRAIHHPIWDRPRYRKTPIHTHISYDG